LGNSWALCFLLPHLGFAAELHGDVTKAGACYQECLTLARELGDKSLIAGALNMMGQLMFVQGNSAVAAAMIQESLILARELGNKFRISVEDLNLGYIAKSQGDLSQAMALFSECFSIGQEIGDKQHIAWALIGLADVAAAAGQPQRAARLFATAEVVGPPIVNFGLNPIERAAYEEAVAAARAQLGEQAFAAAWAEGRMMTPEQAFAFQEPTMIALLDLLPSPPTPSSPPASSGLTRRELEVLRLLAMGLADAQIAEQLVLSLHTVHAHLRTIYSKLGVTSRSAATRYAYEHQLVRRPSP
jgi:ATP/maltotriose-dependent transcriptional regulator MalT